MQRLLGALLALATAGAGIALPLHGPSQDDPPAPATPSPHPYPATTASATVVAVPAVCILPPPPAAPPPLRATYQGTLDPERRELDVRFPVVDAALLEHAVVRFEVEGASVGGHRVALVDAVGRTLAESEGTVVALDRAPVAGVYLARLSAVAPISEAVRATVDVRYAAEAAYDRPYDWPFTMRLDPHGTASVGLDVQDARPAELHVAWAPPPLADLELRILDENGNALATQRWQGASPPAATLHLPWDARAFEVRDVGASAPASLDLTLYAIPRRAEHPVECMPYPYGRETVPAHD